MKNRWSDGEAASAVQRWAAQGEGRALCAYASGLLGADPNLVLFGGGNTSVKADHTDAFGDPLDVLWVKASGHDLATLTPAGLTGLELGQLRRLRRLDSLSDAAMASQLRARQLDPDAAAASIEALLHAWIPARFVFHTHADALLVLGSQPDGQSVVRAALGDNVIVLPYVKPGFALAKAVANAAAANPGANSVVLLRHGVVTWGDDARTAYGAMIELIDRAEQFIAKHGQAAAPAKTASEDARRRIASVGPVLRGLLAGKDDASGHSRRRVVLRALTDPDILAALEADGAPELLTSAVVTTDHLIRTKNLPLWVDVGDVDDVGAVRERLSVALARYVADYEAYVGRYRDELAEEIVIDDPFPRVVLMPGIGALCAGGDARAADVAADITRHTLRIKTQAAAVGGYRGVDEVDAFHMEYSPIQRAKLSRQQRPTLTGTVAIVTGGAGAIGGAVARRLLEHGAHVAVADLPGVRLDDVATSLGEIAPQRVLAVPVDVTDRASVASAFAATVGTWGGVDFVVIGAGVAHVAKLAELTDADFAGVHRVNVEGTLSTLREAAELFERQNTGGDIVLISTKNVFAPGASFGAYSATKAASHQLGRIASVELAPLDVRVNMVAPDGVFADGDRRSGLWQQVGPDRMRARGLDEAGLEDYYRDRNLLKTRVTGDHVANAVLFFLSRQTPTTGVTLPVDGGLPEATPR